MTLAQQYAKALWSATESDPTRGKEYLSNLRGSLKRRGHEQLLPHIFHAYEHLAMQAERRTARSKVSPEERRTRVLVELYKKLITS